MAVPFLISNIFGGLGQSQWSLFPEWAGLSVSAKFSLKAYPSYDVQSDEGSLAGTRPPQISFVFSGTN